MSVPVAVRTRWSSVHAIALLMLVGVSRVCAVVPQLVPDPRIAGFSFPVSEATLTGDVTAMSHGDPAATRRIYLHGWGLWAGANAGTSQRYEAQLLRVFETWASIDDLTADDGAENDASRARAALPHGANRLRLAPETDSGFAIAPGFVGAIKFDPTAADHIREQRLLDLTALDALLASGASGVSPFPARALVAKPVYRLVHRHDLVEGRYALLRVWTGPPATPQAWGPDRWTAGVWVDVLGGGTGRGAVDTNPVPDGSSRTPQTTYPLGAFISHRLSAADAGSCNAANIDANAEAGDIALLVAMHLAGRELARWTWQTFWWTPDPAQPPPPSSAAIAAVRPARLDAAAAHYAMTLAYTMLATGEPFTGGSNTAPAVYAYNPWIEAHFTAADLPDSAPGFASDGSASLNNTGVQTNCMSCHAQATYHRADLASAPRFTGARYVDLGDPQYVGTLQTDFLWALSRHAR